MFGLQRLLRLAGVLALALSLSACISTRAYVDNSLGDPNYAALKKPAQPQPVQLLFEFQSKGVANANATDFLKSSVYEQVSQSGLFSQVSYLPVPSGKKLTVSINNVPATDDAVSKGVGVGLTFGLVGTGITDLYVCTASYLSPGREPVTKEIKHSSYSTVGNKAGPPGLKPLSLDQAVRTVVAQMLGKALQEIDDSSDLAQ